MARAPVVLIVSEHEWASRSLDTVLAPRGYAIVRAYNGAQALERAASCSPDAVFVDRTLPDTTGLEVVRRLRESDAVSAAAPLLLTTAGPTTQSQRLEALRAGAWEVLSLPMDAEELLLRLERYTRAKLEADRLVEEALVDAETGLYTRTGIVQRTQELAAAAERYGRPLACIVFEPDTGADEDLPAELLGEIAGLLREKTRRSDVIGRIGPRQFVIVAPDTPEEGARVVADRLRGSRAGGNGGRSTGARASFFAVPDLADATLEPADLLARATQGFADPGRGAPALN